MYHVVKSPVLMLGLSAQLCHLCVGKTFSAFVDGIRTYLGYLVDPPRRHVLCINTSEKNRKKRKY